MKEAALLTLIEAFEVQAKYRAALPELVDREAVIRLICEAVDEAIVAFAEFQSAKPTSKEARP